MILFRLFLKVNSSSRKIHTQIPLSFLQINKNFDKTINIVKSPHPEIELPMKPIHSYVLENIEKWNDHIAIECAVSGRAYKYKELRRMNSKFSKSLQKLGLDSRHCVSIVLPNVPEFPIAYLGALGLGLKVNPVNPFYSTDDIHFQLNHSESDCVVCHPINLKSVQQAAQKCKKTLNIIVTPDIDGSESDEKGVLRLSEMIDEDSPEMTDDVDIDIEETALIAYSSGTTGVPKGTCLTHKAITTNLAQVSSEEIAMFQETTDDTQVVVPSIIPWTHTYGNILLLLNGLRSGVKLITLHKFDKKVFSDLLLKETKDVTLLAAPPLIFFLGSNPMIKKEHLQGINRIYTAAAPCASSDVKKVHEKHIVPILQVYGLTETCALTCTTDCNVEWESNAIGYLFPNTLGKVIDLTDDCHLGAYESGELCFKGPQFMKYYLKNEKATKDSLDQDGWFRTGDVGYFDDRGCFHITDRLKELIKVKGFQVAPAELEEVLRRHPDVSEAGVVGIPCPKVGETPIAFVSLHNKAVEPEQILEFANKRLTKHKHICRVIILESIPKTPSGKILRKHLRAQASELNLSKSLI